MQSILNNKLNNKIDAENKFNIKDCALIELSSGKRAQDLRELRDIIAIIPEGSIYHHFWGSLLKPSFELKEFKNDFAQWINDALHDVTLAEKLGILDPDNYEDLEGLRNDIIDIIEENLYERECLPIAQNNQLFHFMHANIVVFSTNKYITQPQELLNAVKNMSVGSIFYHFVDARRRTEDKLDDFSEWLNSFDGYNDLIKQIKSIDPFFIPLSKTKNQLYNVLENYFLGEKDE